MGSLSICESSIKIIPIANNSNFAPVHDSANTAVMNKHSLILVHEAALELNPGHISNATVDQPLYALAKKIQWSIPQKFGADECVIPVSGLRIKR
jgi:hypothetical protein